MKDEIYYNLLNEVKARISSSIVNPWDTSLETEMNRVKDILISSGHDLKDMKEFTAEIQSYIYDGLSR